jgi:hypothetical protein
LLPLVEGRCQIEGGEEFGQLVRRRLPHDCAKIGNGVEQCLDLLGCRRGRLHGSQLPSSLIDGVATGAEFFDALLGERDDWMVWVVVFFEAERLPVERAIDLRLFVVELGEFGLALVVA